MRSSDPRFGPAWSVCYGPFDDTFVGAWSAAAASHAGLTVADALARGRLIVRGRGAAPASYPRLENIERWLVERDAAPWLPLHALFAIGRVRLVRLVRLVISMASLGPLYREAAGRSGLRCCGGRMLPHIGPVPLFLLPFAAISVNQRLKAVRLAGALASFCQLEETLEAGTQLRVQARR